MALAPRLAEYVNACFTGLWIQSHEHDDALSEIARLCQSQDWRLAIWDIDRGLSIPGSDTSVTTGPADPLAAIRALSSLAGETGSTLLVLVNFHRFLQSAEVVQALAHQISAGKQRRTFVVILSPVVQIPVELEKQLVILEHELPGRDQLAEIARGVATEPHELPTGADEDRLLDAAAGFTRHEAENAFSLSLARHGRLETETLWELKGQWLKKSGLLQLYRGREDFSALGGLASLKAFCKRALLPTHRVPAQPRPRGVLLLSPPGCGKSQFCKALGRETGRPVLMLDVGSLLGALVGQTEERTRQVLRTVDAMGRGILMIDEVEKALSGVAASGQTDSGVSARLFGSLLGWLNDHESDVFVVCTANDVSKLPPEFSRAERFDGVSFLDLPGRAEREAIWSIYRMQFGIDPDQRAPADDQWTGAEIRACCRLAALLDLPLVQAAQHVVPVAVTAAETVDRLRSWASGRCLSADSPGVYRRNGSGSETPRRRVSRGGPSHN
jgi:hypothetical protein